MMMQKSFWDEKGGKWVARAESGLAAPGWGPGFWGAPSPQGRTGSAWGQWWGRPAGRGRAREEEEEEEEDVEEEDVQVLPWPSTVL